jgi:hypothetical protein
MSSNCASLWLTIFSQGISPDDLDLAVESGSVVHLNRVNRRSFGILEVNPTVFSVGIRIILYVK